MPVNNSISIFVASSFEVHNTRVAIGDCIRKLNDKYEGDGIRVRLNCWEDYKPEYVGERKQNEYNRDLVLTSQILIGLFKTRCGGYTQEEVKLGIKHLGTENVHCFYETDGDIKSLTGDVANFFYENSINAEPYCSIDDICIKVTALVECYINKHCCKERMRIADRYISTIYATIPFDLKYYVPEIGNIVRQLDLICENNFQIRCKLSTLHTPSKIIESDYYIGIFDKEFSDYDLYELQQANMARTYGRMNALAIYEKPGANSDVKQIMNEWGHFPIRLDHLDVLRLKTLIYLLSNIKNIGFVSLATNNNIEFKDNCIMCCNSYIGDFNALNTLKEGLFSDEINKWNDVQARLCLLEKEANGQILNNPTSKYLQLSQEKKNLEQQLKKFFTLAVDFLLKETECTIKENQRLRELYITGKFKTVINEIDTKSIAKSAIKDISIIGDRRDSINAKLERIEIKIKSLISVLISGEQSYSDLDTLYNSLDDKLAIQENAYLHRIVSETDIIATLKQYISVVDTWSDCTFQKEDPLYEKIVKYAETGKVSTIEIENIRGNYANSLSRNCRLEEASMQYEIAIKNILALRDSSRNARKSVCQIYLNYISCFDEFYDGSHLDVLNRWKSLVEEYAHEDKSFNIELLNVYIKEIHHLPLCSNVDNHLVKTLETLVRTIVEGNAFYDEREQHNLLHNIIVLACFYIDRFEQNPQLCTLKAINFLDIATDICRHHQKSSPNEATSYRAQINHNRAFLYTHNYDWRTAEQYYTKAYKEREELCNILHNEDSKSNLAETAVNISDCMLHLKRYDDSIKYAIKSVELYGSLLQPEYEHTYMNFYKAKQMLGSIYVRLSHKKEEGLNILEECWKWAQEHPNNSYQETFEDISYKILKANGRV